MLVGIFKPDSLVRYLRIVIGTGVALLGVGGYFLFFSIVRPSQPDVLFIKEEAGNREIPIPILEPTSSSTHNYEEFDNYINEETTDQKEMKALLKRRSEKPNSFGVIFTLDKNDKQLGVTFKRRF